MVPVLKKEGFRIILYGFVCLSPRGAGFAQKEEKPDAAYYCGWQKAMIERLAGPIFCGRGYVNDGMAQAARAVADSFTAWGFSVPPFYESRLQPFEVSANTFPGVVELKWGRQSLAPGLDFHVHPASPSLKGRFRMRVFTPSQDQDLKNFKPAKDLIFIDYLHAADDSARKLLRNLEKDLKSTGLPLLRLPEKQEPWFPSPEAGSAFVATLHPRAAENIKKPVRRVRVHIDSRFEKKLICYNALGYLPGREKDSLIMVTAHLDHLGMMGREALYGGANDNASGTAMMMALAKAFAARPQQQYSMLFVGFGAEELGLVGSFTFTEAFKNILPRIRFVLNLDLMGGADKGITFVNGQSFPELMAMADSLNRSGPGLTQIHSRPNAPNSDHYPFTQAGVPAVFVFANGEGIAYHDVLDRADRLPWHNCPRLFTFFYEFLRALQSPVPSQWLQPQK